jgi:hypothetical protein
MPADDSYDFFGVRLQARIQVTRGGAGLAFDARDPLGGDAGVPDFIRFLYSSLEEIRVSEQMGMVSTIEVTFSVPYNIGVEVTKSQYIQRTNILHVNWGYSKTSKHMRGWLSGIIVSPPKVRFGATTDISFTANGWGHAMMRHSGIGSVSGTAQSAFKAILTEYKFDLKNLLDDGLASKSWTNPIRPFPRATLSDWGVLRTLCSRTGNDFFISGNKVVVAAKDRVFESTPKRAIFRIFGQIDPVNATYPMSNFELMNADALFIPPFQSEITATYMDSEAKKIEQTTELPSKQGTKGGMKGTNESVPTPKDSPISGGHAVQKPTVGQGSPSMNPHAARGAPLGGKKHVVGATGSVKEAQVSGVAAQAQTQSMYIQVGWDAPGLPWMTPEVVVDLQGVGLFEGSYLVQTVEHTIGRNGYEMHCEGVSRSAAQALLGNTPAIAGILNLQEPSPKGGAA